MKPEIERVAMSSATEPSPPDAESSPPIACAACLEAIAEHYFEINRTIVCETCRSPIEDQLRAGLGSARFARAAVFGLGGSIVGTALYLAFLSISSDEWSLAAVVVGYLVGKMVRKGSGGLGGTACQMLAVVLTYASLAMTSFFALLVLWRGNQVAWPTWWDLVSILNEAVQRPVLRMRSSPVHVVLVGFALWEAWRLNRRPRQYVVTGPHAVDPIL